MRVLFIQFANSMFLRHEDCDGYWDAFYKKYNNIGYWRNEYSFEVPKWIAEIDFLIDKREHESKLFYCKNSLMKFLIKLKHTDQHMFCFL